MINLTTVASDGAWVSDLIAKWAMEEDQSQAELRHNETRRHNFLLARAALRALLDTATGIKDWYIRPDSTGKPYLLSPTGVTAPHISISHTKGLVACAVASSPIGIDVEYWRTRDFTALANYAFGIRERLEVETGGAASFYHIWTLKEAMAKATGDGLVGVINGKDNAACVQNEGFTQATEWQFYCTSPMPLYSLAIASQDQNAWSEKSLGWVNVIGAASVRR